MIPQETIDQIKGASNIVEVVEDFISLKRAGQNWTACCPFHDERTPSFSVHATKNMYKCFGCGKAGDSISFIREIEGISYIEALKYLASKYSIEIEERELNEQQQQSKRLKESLYRVLSYAKDYFNQLLLNSTQGKETGLSYFNKRGFKEAILKKFELGYSQQDWNAFKSAALAKGYNQEVIEQAGLIIKNGSKHYDRFRGRAIFPIHNVVGKVIAFGARTLTEQNPKYLNSPETEVYHKSNSLYGLFQAKEKIRLANNCYVVEGYTDVISLHQGGIENVVASLGTSLTEHQIELIKQFTNYITVLYDGDTAGIKASLRGIDLLLKKDINVKVVRLPKGEDPDSYIHKIGAVSFKQFLTKNSVDFILFKTRLYVQQPKNDPIKKAEVIKDIVTSINQIPNGIKRAVFYKECSQLLEIDEELLINEGNKILFKEDYKRRNSKVGIENHGKGVFSLKEQADQKEDQLEKNRNPIYYQEKEYIRILLQFGHQKTDETHYLYDHLFQEIEGIELSHSLYKEIFLLYKKRVASGQSVNEKYFRQHLRKEIKEEAINLLSEKHQLSKNWNDKFKITVPDKDENLGRVVYTTILRLKLRVLENLRKESDVALKDAKGTKEVMEIVERSTELEKQKRIISKELGIVGKS